MPEAADFENAAQRIEHRWEAAMQAQHQALNWLLTINTGGIAGALAYAATKGSNLLTLLAVIAFGIGVISLIVFAFVYYLIEDRFAREIMKDGLELVRTQDYATFQSKDAERPDKYPTCIVLAYTAGVMCIAGVVISAVAVLMDAMRAAAP